MTRLFSNTLPLYLLCIFLAPTTIFAGRASIDLATLDFNNRTFPIFSQGSVRSEWDSMLLPCNTCSPPDLVAEKARAAIRNFNITNTGDSNVVIDNLKIRTNASNNAIMSPVSNLTSQKTLAPNEVLTFSIEYNCDNKVILDQDLDGWGYIQIGFTADGEPINFNYLKICNTENRQGSDMSIYIILVIAILVVATATRQKKTLLGEQAQHMDEIQPMHAVFFVVFASISLLTLYFFSAYIKDILSMVFIVYSLTACSVLFTQWTEKYIVYNAVWTKHYNIKFVGPVNLHSFVCFLVALAIVVSWFITRTWYLNNVIGLSIVCLIFKIVKLPSLKVAYLLLGLAFFYDIFWVFISKPIFGESVMVVAATALDLPIKIEWPHLSAAPLAGCSFLGLGDMVLPGFFVTFNYRFGLYKKSNAYYWSSVVAYAGGLMLCIGFLILMGMGQPALLYLVPAMLGAATCVSLKRGEFKEMWEGIPEDREYKDFDHQDNDRVQLNEIHTH